MTPESVADSEGPRVAVIGAGLAGLTAARTLQDKGVRVSVFERARQVGGRSASRRDDAGTFDHGAQYFTVSDEGFAAMVRTWQAERIVARWTGRIVQLAADGAVKETSPKDRYVAVPEMRALATSLGAELSIRTGVAIESMERKSDIWRILAADGSSPGSFDAVLLAVAPEQAIPLLTAVPDLETRVASVHSEACWAAMVQFESPLSVAFDAAFVEDDCLAWVARDSSKPARATVERWVLHAAPAWSAARVERDRAQVAEEMLQALRRRIGAAEVGVVTLKGHRWKLARVPAGLGVSHLWDPAAKTGLCGDWLLGSRVENAFLSGSALAEEVARTLT